MCRLKEITRSCNDKSGCGMVQLGFEPETSLCYVYSFMYSSNVSTEYKTFLKG